MTITADHAGRRYPPTPAYEVSAAKIAEFARALGDDSPAYAGEHPIAPPTFVAVISSAAWESMFVPMRLRDFLRDVTVPGADGAPVPLVVGEELVYRAKRAPEPTGPLRSCKACGATVNANLRRCPSCNYQLRKPS